MAKGGSSWLVDVGRVLFAGSLLGFGVEYALLGRLADGLPPLPYWLPYRMALAYLAAALLVGAGMALLAERQVRAGSLVAGIFLVGGACLHLTRFHAVVFRGSERTTFFEALALGASALVLHGLIGGGGTTFCRVLGRVLFALSMVVFGVQHFLNTGIARLIPRYIRFHLFWVIFTGVCLVAAGIAILARVAARAAAVGLFAMFFGWLVLLHIPLVTHAPGSGPLWASALVVLGLSGGSLIVAGE